MPCHAPWWVDGNADIADIRHLAGEIGLTDVADALALVGSFYPNAQLQPKVQFGIEEIFARLADGSSGKEAT